MELLDKNVKMGIITAYTYLKRNIHILKREVEKIKITKWNFMSKIQYLKLLNHCRRRYL